MLASGSDGKLTLLVIELYCASQGIHDQRGDFGRNLEVGGSSWDGAPTVRLARQTQGPSICCGQLFLRHARRHPFTAP
jgi:hypothetical protein